MYGFFGIECIDVYIYKFSLNLIYASLCVFQLHKVVVPDDGSQNKARISIPLFVHPDCDTLIECVDGSDKYPPVTPKDEFTRMRKKLYY